jgi:uncharacterized protein (TIGR02678 family)
MTTFAQDATGRRSAARYLLLHPIVTAARQPAELALVRRHASALKSMFATLLGYTLVAEADFARLIKDLPDPTAQVRPARRATDDAPYTPSSYVCLALVCAALLAPGVGEQILISALVEQIRADAADQSIPLGDSIADRRRIVTVLALLTSWGLLTETDGSVAAWGERRQDEALLTINRPLLAHLLPSPLHAYDSAYDSYTALRDDQPRRRLRRRLVEHPVVLRSQLPEDELDVLSRERTELARQLDEHFGLVLEVRAEGAVAYDPEGELTDVEFPGSGTLRQAALLLLDELVGQRSADTLDENGHSTDGVLAEWSLVDDIVTRLVDEHRKSWKTGYVESPTALRTDIVDLLASLALVVARDDGLMVMAPAARYRPTVIDRSPQQALFEGSS